MGWLGFGLAECYWEGGRGSYHISRKEILHNIAESCLFSSMDFHKLDVGFEKMLSGPAIPSVAIPFLLPMLLCVHASKCSNGQTAHAFLVFIHIIHSSSPHQTTNSSFGTLANVRQQCRGRVTLLVVGLLK